MKKELRRVVAVLLSVVMLISNVPVTALADWWTDSSAGAPFAIGAQPYAVDREHSIVVGESKTFSGDYDRGYENHSWTVNDTSGLDVSFNGASVTVTGLKAGDYTLTHECRDKYFNQKSTEQFLIHVQGITVSFDLNGGSGSIASVSADARGYVTLPADVPTWQGHVFKGWTMPGSDTTYAPGQTIQVTADLTMTARWAAMVTLSFDLNGGSGTTPATISGESGETIALPYGTGLSLPEHTFLGWSPKADAITLESDNTKAEIYPAGELYQLTSNTTLYAVWARADGTQPYTLCIAVRRDGKIPGEPANHSAGSYVELFNGSVDNVVDYFSPLQTVYGENVVMGSLKQPFWDLVNDNVGKLARTRVAFDPETQEIVFYVIKLQAVSSAWHIDGVVRDKSMVHLDYNGNGYTAGLVPDSDEMYKGDNATIAQPGNYKEADQTGWLDLARSGYTFAGWNTAADGSGTSYQPGTTLQVNNNITLYAQWKPNIHGITYKFVGTYPQDAILPHPNRAVHQGTTVQKPQIPSSADAAYVFEGWTTPANVTLNGNTYAMPDDDVVWVGQWRASTKQLTINKTWTEKDNDFDARPTLTFTITSLDSNAVVATVQMTPGQTSVTVDVPTTYNGYTVTESASNTNFKAETPTITLGANDTVASFTNTRYLGRVGYHLVLPEATIEHSGWVENDKGSSGGQKYVLENKYSQKANILTLRAVSLRRQAMCLLAGLTSSAQKQ